MNTPLKTLGFIVSTAIFTMNVSAASARETVIIPLPVNPGVSCEAAINGVTADLAKKGFFIPWQQRIANQTRRIQPGVFRDKDIRESFFDYPPERPEVVAIQLSGDMNKLYAGVMSSPRYMAALSGQIISACNRVGLVTFRHWWEGYIPFGYFSDGSVREFKLVDINPNGTKYMRTIQTRRGATIIFLWGYYFSP
jgi:hypothetical protein